MCFIPNECNVIPRKRNKRFDDVREIGNILAIEVSFFSKRANVFARPRFFEIDDCFKVRLVKAKLQLKKSLWLTNSTEWMQNEDFWSLISML